MQDSINEIGEPQMKDLICAIRRNLFQTLLELGKRVQKEILKLR